MGRFTEVSWLWHDFLGAMGVSAKDAAVLWKGLVKSTHAIWEPAAGRAGALGHPLTFDQMTCIGGGLARIMLTLEALPLTWTEMRRLISPRFLALIAGHGGDWIRANQHRWYGTTQPIDRTGWLAIEVWRAPAWRDCPFMWSTETPGATLLRS
jgi:hypothetical protein